MRPSHLSCNYSPSCARRAPSMYYEKSSQQSLVVRMLARKILPFILDCKGIFIKQFIICNQFSRFIHQN
ncbi:hypothetical protein FGO68_gene5178 [Halteria grandinella]|uniref:Uncharacterized protein n=1 Tax=Halteria grandinella TaxID=5974 RepID=A0A8J8NR90_HALGN|nr:hypothetical protein FGO68_gene5178 [Halteria grandinella]